MTLINHILLFFSIMLFTSQSLAQSFDHDHALWTRLLTTHVTWIKNDRSSTEVTTVVDYAGFKKDQTNLKTYIKSLADVSEQDFYSWNKEQKLAFLINAYNAYTIELILTRYPNLKSIKDLGSLISSPWSKANYPLLGKKRSLDDIEHSLIRGASDFNEPRIHFAVNCASVGCPALRSEAFIAEKLILQLEDQTKRFIKDRTRNYLDKSTQTLYVSKIFDWYRNDFEKGFLGANTLEQFLARYAGSLGLTNTQKKLLLQENIDIEFTEYDWLLNVKR